MKLFFKTLGLFAFALLFFLLPKSYALASAPVFSQTVYNPTAPTSSAPGVPFQLNQGLTSSAWSSSPANPYVWTAGNTNSVTLLLYNLTTTSTTSTIETLQINGSGGGGDFCSSTNSVSSTSSPQGVWFPFTFDFSGCTVGTAGDDLTEFIGGLVIPSPLPGGYVDPFRFASMYGPSLSYIMPYMIVNSDLGFVTPTTGSQITVNTDQPFSAYCPQNGDQIAIVGIVNGNFVPPTSYPYTCLNGSVMGTFPISSGMTGIEIIDQRTSETASVSITPIEGTTNNQFASTTIPQIAFQNPPFSPGFSSPDFTNWWVCVFLPSNGTTSAFSYSVFYGASSTTLTQSDSLLAQFGQVPQTIGSQFYGCPELAKTSSTTPGSYVAYTALYDQNNATIATSSLLSFTITSGTPLLVPNNNLGQSNSLVSCNATTYQLFGWDFGQAMCNVLAYLFVPQTSDFTQFQTLLTTVTSAPPLGYFTNINSSLNTNLSEQSTTTLMTQGVSSLGVVFTPIRTGFQVLLLLLLGLALYFSIAKFNWHS